VKILYLTAVPPFSSGGTAVPPVGRSLVRHLSAEHELQVRGAVYPSDSPVFEGQVSAAVMSADELEGIDVIFMEGGWNEDDPPRFPLELAESFVRRGGQLIVAGTSRTKADSQRESIEEARDLFGGASFDFRKVGRKEGFVTCMTTIKHPRRRLGTTRARCRSWTTGSNPRYKGLNRS